MNGERVEMWAKRDFYRERGIVFNKYIKKLNWRSEKI